MAAKQALILPRTFTLIQILTLTLTMIAFKFCWAELIAQHSTCDAPRDEHTKRATRV